MKGGSDVLMRGAGRWLVEALSSSIMPAMADPLLLVHSIMAADEGTNEGLQLMQQHSGSRRRALATVVCSGAVRELFVCLWLMSLVPATIDWAVFVLLVSMNIGQFGDGRLDVCLLCNHSSLSQLSPHIMLFHPRSRSTAASTTTNITLHH